jgi:hypothetical protein
LKKNSKVVWFSEEVEMRSKVLLLFAAFLPTTVLCTTSAMANPISLLSSTSAAVVQNGSDVFDLAGMNKVLMLDSSLTSEFVINTGLYTAGLTLPGVRTFNLSSDLTLGGITHTLTQPIITTFAGGLFQNTIAVSPSVPVLFETPEGSWDVNLKGYLPVLLFPFGPTVFPVIADFTPVPEPATFGLLGALLVVLPIGLSRRSIRGRVSNPLVDRKVLTH